MRALRTSCWAAAALLGLAPGLAHAQSYSPEKLLQFKPSVPGVEYDTPDSPAAVAACKVEPIERDGRTMGYSLRDGQGKLLRKFADTNGLKGKDGKPHLDQWSYYRDGFEVYREVDTNEDGSLDECRWLNAGGTRIGQFKGGRVVAWKRISAEEASKVLVQALVSRDAALVETVMATPEELTALGVPKGEVDRVAEAAAQRADQVQALTKELVGWDASTVWLRFDGTMPHIIPADTGAGLKGDLELYENAVIFVGQASGQGDPTKFAYLQAGEMVAIGPTWKFVELPRAINPRNPAPIRVAQDAGIRAWVYREAVPGAPQNPQTAAALKALADFDAKHAEALNQGDKRKVAEFYVNRVPLIREVVKLTTDREEKLSYNKQIADSLAAAYSTGHYPKGPELLDVLAKEGGEIAAYAAYTKIMAENALKVEQPDANQIALQKELLAKLEQYLGKYRKSEKAPEVLLQLASFNEFNAEEEQARKFYTQLADGFPETQPGKKAAGALRRLDLVGKPLALKGTGLRGEPVDAAAARGKVLLVVFWATWANPAKSDLPELLKTYQKHRPRGFEIIGVSLDNDKAALEEFLKDNPIPWPQIFEPGGMDSRLADEFGIISLPTMILADSQGKVVSRSIRTAAELEKQLEKLGLEKPPTTALGNNR